MRNVGIDGAKVGAIQISTDPSPIERRVGLACKIAKLNMGVLTFSNYPILYSDKKKSFKNEKYGNNRF